jgi:hypothetical protein
VVSLAAKSKYNIGVLTVKIEFMWRGLETRKRTSCIWFYIANTRESAMLCTSVINISYYRYLNTQCENNQIHLIGSFLFVKCVWIFPLFLGLSDQILLLMPHFLCVISLKAILWRPVLVVEEAGVSGENHRQWASNW